MPEHMAGKKRVRVDNHIFLEDLHTGIQQRMFPANWSVRNQFTSNHTVDRCGIGVGACGFAQGQGMTWVTHYGVFHDIWNSIRNSAKTVEKGRGWRFIHRFTGICNMNHGPMRSGAWRRMKEKRVQAYEQTHNKDSPDFRVIVVQQARLIGRPCETEEHFEREFKHLC